MTREWTAKSFKSGNSVALRVPATVGIVPGEQWRLVEDGEGYRLDKRSPSKRKIDVSKFCGKSPGLRLLAPEDRLFEERPPARSDTADASVS